MLLENILWAYPGTLRLFCSNSVETTPILPIVFRPTVQVSTQVGVHCCTLLSPPQTAYLMWDLWRPSFWQMVCPTYTYFRSCGISCHLVLLKMWFMGFLLLASFLCPFLGGDLKERENYDAIRILHPSFRIRNPSFYFFLKFIILKLVLSWDFWPWDSNFNSSPYLSNMGLCWPFWSPNVVISSR